MASLPRMKPEFRIPLDEDGDQVMYRLKDLLERDECPVVGRVLSKHASIQLPPEKRSLLSPYLNLDLVPDGDTFQLVGKFSPHPHVWTGFMAIYGVLTMVGLAGLMYGFAQMTVEESPWAMLAAPVAVAAIAFVYGAAVIGQGLTADEMHTLRMVVDRATLKCMDKRSTPHDD